MKRNSLLLSAVILSVTLIGAGSGKAAPDIHEAYAEALGLDEAVTPRLRVAAAAIATDELAELRGGFAMPGGMMVSFGFDIETRLGGVTAERLNMPNTALGPNMATPMMTVTDANGVARQVAMSGTPFMVETLGANGATRIQTMISNGITSIVQNAANGQQVQRFATVTVDVAGMRSMLNQFGQNRVLESAISAQRAIPR
ncbi:MAG: hypothetical protein FJX32_12630 [Alphaproteobacteria bacterium]|nr:hypothetical protein [Alphaproteobacteria bacterium]